MQAIEFFCSQHLCKIMTKQEIKNYLNQPLNFL